MKHDSGKAARPLCCICGKELPNRYSVAGVCGEPDCRASFCGLHWRRGNRRCQAHGYDETNPAAEDETVNEERNGKRTGKAGGAMKEALVILKKLGAGTAALARKIRKDRSPAAVIAAMEAQLQETGARKVKAAAEVEHLHGEIVARKSEVARVSRARREILEEELRGLLVAYEAAKRTYKILLENERHMQLVKGRLSEVDAYGMSPVTEEMMDEVIDSLDESAESAVAVADAARDLEKAGRRRQREEDGKDLWAALAEFDEEEAGPASERAGRASEVPAPPRAGAGREGIQQEEQED